MTEPTDAERAQFEKMMRRETFDDLSRVSDGSYKSYEARVGWIAWQAARRTPAPVGVEPVAWKHDCAALLTNDVELWVDACPHCGKPHTADQVLAMGRVPLTRQQLREAFYRDTACTLGGDVDLAEKVCRVVEKAHGIKQGGQHVGNVD